MRTVYTVTDRETPWIVLFSALTLEALADCLAAQPDRQRLAVGANEGSFTRPLGERERAELARLVGAAGARSRTVTPGDRGRGAGDRAPPE